MSPKEITEQPSNNNEVQTSPNLTGQPAPAITNTSQEDVVMVDRNDTQIINNENEKTTSDKPDSLPAMQEALTKKVLTPSNYHAERIITPANTGSLLRACLEAAANEFFSATDKTQEELAILESKHKEALKRYTLYIKTQEALKQQPKANNLKNIVPKNMPMLQIQGGVVRDSSKPIHNSLDSFISAFERQLKSHNLPLDNYWERLFWVCLNDDQIPWFRHELLDKNCSWETACARIKKEYGNPFHIFIKRHELFAAHPKEGESIHAYTERWVALAHDAGRKGGVDLTFDFISSLSSSIREKVYPVLACIYGIEWPTEVMEVAQLVITTIGEQIDNKQDITSSSSPSSNKKRHFSPSSEEPSAPSKSKRKYGNCPVHPKGSHSSTECSVLKKQKEIVGQQLKQATNNNNNLCKFCKKVPYKPGHKCQEFYEFKKNNNSNKNSNHRTFHNHSLHVVHYTPSSLSSTSNTQHTPSQRSQDILDEILLPAKMDGMDLTD
ncbi:hypothetical protein BDA99DRAFT_533948 [Phascolomyces articulosus]|uniref:Retrotransposon gag domain-containing protein n=1 Tax=Phascolomyces articulosus TaxID=60185 RepID=A0AAD5K7Z3_9FUNG|nr:hypothetical protein BDA99DRAFT_533948 [Phascolomyces articulosus]